MDAKFIQIHIIGQEKIFLLIWIRDYKWQPLMARLRTGETESPTWASTTSILHHSDSKLTRKRQSWEEHNSAPKGQRDAYSSIVLATMDYSFDTLNSLFCLMLSMYQRVPYIASWWIMKGRIRAISRHMEGQESYESDPRQGMLQRILDYVHIPMYATIEGISAYVRGYRGKGCIYHFSNVLRDGQGYIKRQKVVHRG